MPRNQKPPVLGSTDTTATVAGEMDPNKDPDKKIYRTVKWRNFRARLRREQRQVDEKKAQMMYEQDSSISLEEYFEWIRSGAPLCMEYFREGRLIPARVLDHIKPIIHGGKAWDPANLQWLSHEKHQIKRGRERHQ